MSNDTSIQDFNAEAAEEIQRIVHRLREGFFYPFIREKEIANGKYPTFLTPESQPMVLSEALRNLGFRLKEDGKTDDEKDAGYIMAMAGVTMRIHERAIGEAVCSLLKIHDKLTALAKGGES